MRRAVHGLTRLAALPMATAALAVPASSAQGADKAAAVIRAINAQRAANGLPPVRRDRSLAAVARAHSAHMVARRRFSHGGFGKRIRRSSWARRRGTWVAAETLAWGTGRRGTPAGVVDAWMHSPEHRAHRARPALPRGRRRAGQGRPGQACARPARPHLHRRLRVLDPRTRTDARSAFAVSPERVALALTVSL